MKKLTHPIKDLTPKYKVGDRITNGETEAEIVEVRKVCYVLDNGQFIPMTEQDQWTLVKDPDADHKNINEIFDKLLNAFSEVVTIPETTQTHAYLYVCFSAAYMGHPLDRDYYPELLDVYGDNENPYNLEQMGAMLFYSILTEIIPQKRQKLAEIALNYPVKMKEQPIYGWTYETDPNIARMTGCLVATMFRKPELLPIMRQELGGEMILYKKDISELYLDLTKMMPPAPGPYLKVYTQRQQPVGDKKADGNLIEDAMVDDYVAECFSLDSFDEMVRQTTIQSIANKEHRAVHLFGSYHDVYDPQFGHMTFRPAFGLMNIATDGDVAKMAEAIGKACSDSRKSLLNAEYGRRRPGQGDADPSAASEPKRRALVNEAIENGDGHSTGHYDKAGDYVYDDGTHVGDYVAYNQGQLYANSYTSGHSAYIAGITLAMIELMPSIASGLMESMGWFRLSRVVTRYHHLSDTTIGLLVGMMFVPVLRACQNFGYDERLDRSRKELDGEEPQPEEIVNTSLSYVCGGYGSCHVDAGEASLNHYCNKEANKERHPFINVSQRVEYTIEGADVKTADGKTSGTWEAGKDYELICPAVADGEEKVAKITMRNEHGVRVLNYKLSRRGTHDDGTEGW